MAWVAVAIGGAGLLGAGASVFGSSKQADAANRAIDTQTGMFNTTLGNTQPFIDAGKSALPTLTKLLTPGSDMTEVLKQLPGFQFAQQYGQKAITNQATSRGISGNALTAGADYATGSASQMYGQLVQQLLSTAGLGSGAATGTGSIAASTGANIGSNIIGGANAQAAGLNGAANSIGGAVNGIGNYSLLQSLLQKNSGGGAWSPAQTLAAGMSPI